MRRLQRGVVDHQHGGRSARRQPRQVRGDPVLGGPLQVRIDGAGDAPRLRLLLMQALGQQRSGQRRAQRTRDHRLDRCVAHLRGAPYAEIAHALEHLVACGARGLGTAIRTQPAGRLRQHRQQRRFRTRELAGRLAQVGPRSRLDTFDRASKRRVVEIQVQDLRLAQMRLQLQRTENLHELAAERVRDGHDDPRHLHGQGRAARHDMPMPQSAGETAHQRIRIDAGMPVEPAVLIVQQRREIQRRNPLRGSRITPYAIAVGERAQRRTVTRQHHRAARIGRGQVQREQAVEQQRDQQQCRQRHDAGTQPTPPMTAR